jgi:hypothetical protein
MIPNLLANSWAVPHSQRVDYTLSLHIRPAYDETASGVIGQSGREDRLR